MNPVVWDWMSERSGTVIFLSDLRLEAKRKTWTWGEGSTLNVERLKKLGEIDTSCRRLTIMFCRGGSCWATMCAGFRMRGWLSGLGGEERMVSKKGWQLWGEMTQWEISWELSNRPKRQPVEHHKMHTLSTVDWLSEPAGNAYLWYNQFTIRVNGDVLQVCCGF